MNSPLPTKQEAEETLAWGCKQNPGPWANHCRTAARAAQTIAWKCGLDENAAYTLGLLHDIGRYEGKTGLRHIYTGYRLMSEKGLFQNARICLTHSFPDKDIASYMGNIDCTTDEINFIQTELGKTEFDDYNKLIQLCDAISFAEGICILEVRFVEAGRRYNVLNEKILQKWNAYFELKSYFDTKCGMSIYELFKDEIIKTSIK